MISDEVSYMIQMEPPADEDVWRDELWDILTAIKW